MLTEGAIFVTNIPSDPSGKPRPVLALKLLPKYNDFFICAISAQLHQFTESFDVLLGEDDEHFSVSGLQKTSVIRLGSLAIFQAHQQANIIGFIHPDMHKQLLINLSNHLLNFK